MDFVMDMYDRLKFAEENFQSELSVVWMSKHWEVPIFSVGLYYAIVFGVPGIMKDRSPAPLRPLFALWNLLLSLFSILGASRVIPKVLGGLRERGFHGTICDEPLEFFYNSPAGFWCLIFVLSKIPELLDTVFLVFQKKPVIFLHWYHHITVCLQAWHTWTNYATGGMTYAAMNFFVHSIMYMYYFLMAMNLKFLVKPLAPLITSLQIMQMVVGMVVTTHMVLVTDDSNPGACAGTATNARLGFVMYASYFVLFSKLFLNNYIFKKRRSSEGSAKKKQN